jgi:formylglycine-generating enzyme required for sulfatase activity
MADEPVLPSLLNDRLCTDAESSGSDEIADTLCRILVSPRFEPPLAMCLDGPSGGGRTSLIHAMQRRLEATADADGAADWLSTAERAVCRPCRALIVAPWQCGEGGDALAAALLEQVCRDLATDSFVERFRTRLVARLQATPAATEEALLRSIVGTAVWLAGKAGKAGSPGGLAKDAGGLLRALGPALAEAFGGEAGGDRLGGLFEEEAARAAWQEELGFHRTFNEKLGQFLSVYLDAANDEILVLFIEDPERCGQADAVGFLQTARSLYGTNRCVFVVAAEYEALRTMVRAAMPGAALDATGERDPLEDLFHVRVRLTPTEPTGLMEFCAALLDKLGLGVSSRELMLVRRALGDHVIPLLRREGQCRPAFIARLLNSLSLQLGLRRTAKLAAGEGVTVPSGRARDMLAWGVLQNLPRFGPLVGYVTAGGYAAARVRLDRLLEAGAAARRATDTAPTTTGRALASASTERVTELAEEYELPASLLEDVPAVADMAAALTDFDGTSLQDCLLYGAAVGPSDLPGKPRGVPCGGVRDEELDPDYQCSASARAPEGTKGDLVIQIYRNGGTVDLQCKRIPTGTFATEEDGDSREVRIAQPFHMAATPVTQGQYRAVMGKNPSGFQGSDCPDADERPVEQVTWHAADEFCRRLARATGLDVRLPTEAQWEYSCRAGTTTTFSFGDTVFSGLANYGDGLPREGGGKGKDREHTTAVGTFQPNPWGLHDMHGNVWEWCRDRCGEGAEGQGEGPAGPLSAECRALRGGSWIDPPEHCCSSYRHGDSPDNWGPTIGFRIAVLPGA